MSSQGLLQMKALESQQAPLYFHNLNFLYSCKVILASDTVCLGFSPRYIEVATGMF